MDEESVLLAVKNLDWSLPADTQRAAIKFLRETDMQHLHLIFDKKQKSTWENAVRVIRGLEKIKVEAFIPCLLWLLQDINWPGAMAAVEILSSVEKTKIVPHVEQAISLALDEEDSLWVYGLTVLIQRAGLTMQHFSNRNAFERLVNFDF